MSLQMLDQRRGAEPDSARAFREQLQETPLHAREGNGREHPAGAAPTVKPIQPSQRARVNKLIPALRGVQVDGEQPLFLRLQRGFQKPPDAGSSTAMKLSGNEGSELDHPAYSPLVS